MTKPQKPQAPSILYAVWIQKKNQDSIVAIETESYDEAFDLWKGLTEKWKVCIKEQEPFTIESPIVTAFDPGLVLEINLVPMPPKEVNNNPYKKEMLEKGFTQTLNQYTRGTELLDSGLKR